MYLGSWKIDDALTLTCNTHTAATGAATDADSPPTYRVYEDETGAAILNGAMALLDDANTVGQYSEQITLSAANGFEKGRTYSIRIGAIVATIAGATVRSFQIEAEVDANTVSDATIALEASVIAIAADIAALNDISAADVWAYATRTLTQTLAEIEAALSGDEITVIRGDRLVLSLTDLGDITGYKDVWFGLKRSLGLTDAEAEIIVSDTVGLEIINGTAGVALNGSVTVTDIVAGDMTVIVEGVETAKLTPNEGLSYDVQWLDASDHPHTLSIGAKKAAVSGDVTRATS